MVKKRIEKCVVGDLFCAFQKQTGERLLPAPLVPRKPCEDKNPASNRCFEEKSCNSGYAENALVRQKKNKILLFFFAFSSLIRIFAD